MIDRILIDTFNLRSRDFAVKWKNAIRKNEQLVHYNALSDEAIITMGTGFYPLVAETFDRGMNRSVVGDFFVSSGRSCMRDGFPLSEVIFGINLSQKTVIEYLLTEFAPENPMRMYQSIEALTRLAEFCLHASFYISKGFLEETYTHMSKHDKISDDLLKKYFKDDFFFKKG